MAAAGNRYPARTPVADPTTDKAIEEVRRAQRATADDPFLNQNTITVTLEDNEETRVLHGLGRRFINFWLSPPIGALAPGILVEVPSTDPGIEIRLKATGFGASFKVRVTVF